MTKKPYLPKGCDNQGRYPELADEEPEHGSSRALDVVIVTIILAMIYGLVWILV